MKPKTQVNNPPLPPFFQNIDPQKKGIPYKLVSTSWFGWGLGTIDLLIHTNESKKVVQLDKKQLKEFFKNNSRISKDDIDKLCNRELRKIAGILHYLEMTNTTNVKNHLEDTLMHAYKLVKEQQVFSLDEPILRTENDLKRMAKQLQQATGKSFNVTRGSEKPYPTTCTLQCKDNPQIILTCTAGSSQQRPERPIFIIDKTQLTALIKNSCPKDWTKLQGLPKDLDSTSPADTSLSSSTAQPTLPAPSSAPPPSSLPLATERIIEKVRELPEHLSAPSPAHTSLSSSTAQGALPAPPSAAQLFSLPLGTETMQRTEADIDAMAQQMSQAIGSPGAVTVVKIYEKSASEENKGALLKCEFKYKDIPPVNCYLDKESHAYKITPGSLKQFLQTISRTTPQLTLSHLSGLSLNDAQELEVFGMPQEHVEKSKEQLLQMIEQINKAFSGGTCLLKALEPIRLNTNTCLQYRLQYTTRTNTAELVFTHESSLITQEYSGMGYKASRSDIMDFLKKCCQFSSSKNIDALKGLNKDQKSELSASIEETEQTPPPSELPPHMTTQTIDVSTISATLPPDIAQRLHSTLQNPEQMASLLTKNSSSPSAIMKPLTSAGQPSHISECWCKECTTRKVGQQSVRDTFVNKTLQALTSLTPQNPPPQTKEVTIVSCASGGCFQELALHAKLIEEGYSVTWHLVDPSYFPNAEGEPQGSAETAKEFAMLIKSLNAVKKVQDRPITLWNGFEDIFNALRTQPTYPQYTPQINLFDSSRPTVWMECDIGERIIQTTAPLTTSMNKPINPTRVHENIQVYKTQTLFSSFLQDLPASLRKTTIRAYLDSEGYCDIRPLIQYPVRSRR